MTTHRYPPIPAPILDALGVTQERYNALGQVASHSQDPDTVSHLLDALNEQFQSLLDELAKNTAP